MRQIIVINESPSDVFSEHLLGMKSLEVIRMRFQDSKALDNPGLILLVNQKLDLADIIKDLYPKAKVVAVSGGKSDFQPIMTLIYGPQDHDDFTYGGGWPQFEEILLYEQARLPKYLIYKRDLPSRNYVGKDLKVFRPNTSLLNSFSQVSDSRSFNYFFESSIDLSVSYLNWYQDWITEAKSFVIPLSSRPKKKSSQLEVSFVNEYRGLPIFNAGDSVILLDKNEQVIFLQDHEELPIKISVIQSSVEGITIKFSKQLNLTQFSEICKISLDTFISSNRITQMCRNIQVFLAGKMAPRTVSRTVSLPARSLLCSAFLLGEREIIDYPSEIILNSSTRRILRDQSQTLALLDMLSDKPISWISGPPGTGKTFTAAAAVDNFVHRGAKILLVSHSNLGVDNLVAAVAENVNPDQICRLGNDPEVIDERVRKFHRGLPKFSCVFNHLGDLRLDAEPGIVAACTIDLFLTPKLFKEGYYKPDIIFCDEASKGLLAEIAPLILAAGIKIIFIGDDRQLGNIPIPLPILKYFKAEGFREDAINLFNGGFFNSVMVNQYMLTSNLLVNRRSLPRIVEVVNIFYDGKLIPGRFNPYNDGQVIFLDTKELEANEKREGTSWLNKSEVNIVADRFINQLAKHVQSGGKISDSVIITPYKPQEKALKQKIRNKLLFHAAFTGLTSPDNIDDIQDRAVITVDAIQGGERKFVSISFVRSNDRQDIGFNKDIRRINVAFSRAQEVLIIICNSQTFIDCEHKEIVSAFLQLLQLTKKRHKYFVLK